MFLTEDEARKRWCPFARVIEGSFDPDLPTYAAAVNRNLHESQRPHARCIASGCMMWRSTGPQHDTLAVAEIPEQEAKASAKGWHKTPDRDADGNKIWTKPKPEQGWCGLAGRPIQ